MPQEKNLEFKVGVFILVAAVCLTAVVFSINDSSVFKEGKAFKVIFNFTDGLKKNAPVRIAGVDEGLVKGIDLFFDRKSSQTKVAVVLQVHKNVMIPLDSEIVINQLGMMGEKYVEIFPGTDTKRFYEEGGAYLGTDPVPQAHLSRKMMTVAHKMEQTIEGFNEGTTEDGHKASLGETLRNLNSLTSSLNKIVGNQENIKSLNETLKNLSSVTKGLDDILMSLKEGEGTLGRLIYDGGLYEDLKDMTADLKVHPWKLFYRAQKDAKNED